MIIMLTVGMENGRVSALQLPRITTRWHLSSSQERPPPPSWGRWASWELVRDSENHLREGNRGNHWAREFLV